MQNVCALVGSTTGVPRNRGLQLGEEQAPLISLPDSWRPETAYASYSRRLLNTGRGFLQILARQVLHKCLNQRPKSIEIYFSRTLPAKGRICSVGKPPPDQGSSSVAAVAGRGSCSVISVSPIRSWLAEAGTGDLGVGPGPESLELCVRCGGFG